MTSFKGTAALRRGRTSIIGHYYFMTTVTADRRRLLSSDLPSSIILDALTSANHLARFRTDAAVVMPDHVHFCGVLRSGDLPKMMQSLKGFTSRSICQALQIGAPLWQAGYHDHALRSDEDWLVRMRYLLDNPIRAGLCEHLDEYPFYFCRYQA